MLIEIKAQLEPIDVLGQLDVVELQDNRKVYINTERVERNAELFILKLLDDMSGISGKTFSQILQMKLEGE